ncbi:MULTISPECIES: putative phage abortive infection protein [Sphingobacterium]|uniref:putative phage abortive infection protein n=1 Tax=Sphingobacterium TaxID=28453 RepID=UPI0013DC32B3|nr:MULTISPECIES: putative phage abortive infection protein [unclassified Sphingobacterium]
MNYDLVLGGLLGIATTYISFFCYKTPTKNRESDLLIRTLVIICILTVLFSFIAPFVFTQEDKLGLFNFSDKTGFVGDTIGGIMNPFIALAAVVMTGLAFYAQYQANKQVQDQFKLQQFESHLFKMVDNYNNTINHFKMKSRESKEEFVGKDYFFSLHQEFKSAYDDIGCFMKAYLKKTGDKFRYQELVDVKYLDSIKNYTKDVDKLIHLEIAYVVVFFGVSQSGRDSIQILLKDKYNQEFINELTNCLSYKLQGFSKNDDGKSFWADKKFQLELTDCSNPNKSDEIKYHNGHQSKLGHYYRQNYMLIKFIDDFNDRNIDYDKKWEYSKLLRSLYSNHEQIMMYLNSISIFGRDWELSQKDKNKQWITKYDLIKNIPRSYREKYCINDFYPNVDYEYEKETSERINLNQNVYR